jgi:outer membrane lipoprotein-sorting protein
MRTTVLLAAGLALLLVAPTAVRADDPAEARKIIDKAIKAVGGEEKLAKFKAQRSRIKGKFSAMGADIDYTGEIAVQLPDRMRISLEMDVMGQKIAFLQIFNGNKVYVKVADMEQEGDKDAVEEARQEMHANRVENLVALKDKAYQLSVVGDAKVGDRAAVGVRVSRKDFRDVNLYFDKENGLPLKSERIIKDPMAGGKEMTQVSIYSDYKDVNGLKVPMKIAITRDGAKFLDGESTEVELAEKFDEALFKKP